MCAHNNNNNHQAVNLIHLKPIKHACIYALKTNKIYSHFLKICKKNYEL
jgi:hypothetical protein